MSYTQSQWLLFFFLYCFFGWIWESAFVSVQKKRWVNRGFLRGPWLPIYGFGAIIILFLTIPVRNSIPLIYLLGMVGATVLEYVTGAVMERLFCMRYWDYSKQPLNVNGYISLLSSLAWGAFSILLIKVLHPPIEKLILLIPSFLSGLISIVLVAVFMIDVTRSVQAALDLKEIMKRLMENNTILEAIGEKAEEASREFSRYEIKWKTELQEIRSAREKKDTGVILSIIKRNPTATSRYFRGVFEKARLQKDKLETELRARKK